LEKSAAKKMSRAVWMSDGHRKLFFYGQEEEYIREVPIPNVIPWDTFLSIYPERNVQLYRNHPRRDLYQVWKWLSSRDKTAGDSCWNLAEIFQEEIRNLTGAERTTWKDSPKIDEAWKQLCAEWTRLGFSLDYSTHHPFVGTAACLWIYLSQDNHLSWEESSQLSRVTVLLRCSSDPKQVCKRQDVLSKLPSCALWLLAIMSLHHWEDIVEYYEFLVSYCKDRFRLDGICLLFQNETKEFLQTYLDGTGDVQSATLLSLRLLSTEICPRSWIAEYRRILEHHGQWDLLAQLDIFCGWKPHVKSFGDTTNSLEAICYFCNKSLLHTPFRTSKEGKSSIPDSFPSSWRISSFHHHPRKYERHTVSNDVLFKCNNDYYLSRLNTVRGVKENCQNAVFVCSICHVGILRMIHLSLWISSAMQSILLAR